MADVTWYAENGFYEQHAKQGEDAWADQAEFDAIVCPAQDVKETESAVSFSQLQKPASYGQ